MKNLSLVYLINVVSVAANPSFNTPKIDLNLPDGKFTNLKELDPRLKWSGTASAAGCDLEFGGEASLKKTTDITTLPQSYWGKVTRNIAGWKVAAKTNVDASFANPSFDILAQDNENDAAVNVKATPDGISNVQVSKGFDVEGGRISVNPRYNVKDSKADVILGFDGGISSVTLHASATDQKVVLSQQVTDVDCITPTITSKGDVTLQWKKSLSGGNSITTTLDSKKSIDVKWEDGPWTATFHSTLDDISTGPLDISVKRKMDFF